MDDAKFEENMKNLRDSIIFGKYEEFKRIISREYVEKDGTGWIHWAVRFEQKKILDHLMKFMKLDVNLKDGWTPLHVASSLGLKEYIDILMKSGADKSIQNNDGFYPAGVAVNKEVEKMVGYHTGSKDPGESWLCTTYERDLAVLEKREKAIEDKHLNDLKKKKEERRERKASIKVEKKDVDDQPDYDDDGFMTL